MQQVIASKPETRVIGYDLVCLRITTVSVHSPYRLTCWSSWCTLMSIVVHLCVLPELGCNFAHV